VAAIIGGSLGLIVGLIFERGIGEEKGQAGRPRREELALA
jgi:hypothetical protein